MKLPIVITTRRKYDAGLAEAHGEKGRTIAYVPVDKETAKRLKKATSVNEKYCFHDGRIGWVERKEFENYQAYISWLRSTK